MRFCKKCGTELKDGICPNCEKGNSEKRKFCKVCGSVLINEICENCNKNLEEKKQEAPLKNNESSFIKEENIEVEKTLEDRVAYKESLKAEDESNTINEKPLKVNKEGIKPNKKVVIGITIGLVVIAGGVLGFKMYKDKSQEGVMAEAIECLQSGDYEKAEETILKYKKDDEKANKIKEVNKKYLKLEKECNNGDFSNLSKVKNEILSSDLGEYYTKAFEELTLNEEKKIALDALGSTLNSVLARKEFAAADTMVEKCEKYDLTEEERKIVDEAIEEIKKSKEQAKIEKEAANKEEATNKFLNKYKSLKNKYNDDYIGNAHAEMSEVEKVEVFQTMYMEWDKLLNEIWKELPNHMTKDEFEDLRKVQIKWVEEKMKEEKNDSNPTGMALNALYQHKYLNLSQKTEDRCYEFITKYIK